MSRPLPPLPPQYETDPVMLKWRLDHQEQRIEDLEARPDLTHLAQPMVGRYVLAAALLALGAWGHIPWATALAHRLLGG